MNKKINIISDKKNYKLDYYEMLQIFMLLNYNSETSNKIIQKIVKHIEKNKLNNKKNELVIKKTELNNLLGIIKDKFKNNMIKNLYPYFFITHKILKSDKGLIILIGGASGTGKSSITSYLGSKMGINTIFSTDTIRHISRTYFDPKDHPFLFCSTYECHLLDNDANKQFSDRLMNGYKNQCKIVQKYLFKLIETYYNQGKWVIIEGVHITADFIISVMKKMARSLGFYIYISDHDKHAERLSQRAKNNSLESSKNKYIKHLDSIITIQNSNKEEAKEYKVPIINNKNLDESIKIIYKTILRSIKTIKEKKTLLDNDKQKCSKLLTNYNKVKIKFKNNKIIKENIKRQNKNDNSMEIINKVNNNKNKRNYNNVISANTSKDNKKVFNINEIKEELNNNKILTIKKKNVKTSFEIMKNVLNNLFGDKVIIRKISRDKYIIKKKQGKTIKLDKFSNKESKRNSNANININKIYNKKKNYKDDDKTSFNDGDCSNNISMDNCKEESNNKIDKNNLTFKTNGSDVSLDEKDSKNNNDNELEISRQNESILDDVISIEIESNSTNLEGDYDQTKNN